MHRNTRSGGFPPQKDHITPAPMYFAADAVVVVVDGAIAFALIVLGCEVIAHCF